MARKKNKRIRKNKRARKDRVGAVKVGDATRIRPNAPCPCGSGKKYKRCCRARFQAARAAGIAEPMFVRWEDDLDELDAVSNSVIALVEQGRFDQAEAACEQLARRWPDQIDAIDRLAMVRKAQGRHADAATLYRQAAEHARTHEGFDQARIDHLLDRAARAEASTRETGAASS